MVSWWLCLLVAATALVFGAPSFFSSGAAGDTSSTAPDDRTTNRLAAGRRCDQVLRPHRKIRRFTRSLKTGQTGCLRAGTYRSTNRTVTVESSAVTLRSYPGERAQIVGRVWIPRTARDVVVKRLKLNGFNRDRLPSPTVNGDRAVFKHNNVTNKHTASCFVIGSRQYGTPDGVIIKRNRIHDCGRLPATNHHHGIYVADADDTVIRGNLIHGNADRGIQLYPDADRTRILGNVIDGNGSGLIFSGGDGQVSDGNVVVGNLITNARIRFNVEGHWRAVRAGKGNVVRDNCVFGGARHDASTGGIETPEDGFVAFDNLVAAPLYRDRLAGDFRLAERSRCRGVRLGYR